MTALVTRAFKSEPILMRPVSAKNRDTPRGFRVAWIGFSAIPPPVPPRRRRRRGGSWWLCPPEPPTEEGEPQLAPPWLLVRPATTLLAANLGIQWSEEGQEYLVDAVALALVWDREKRT